MFNSHILSKKQLFHIGAILLVILAAIIGTTNVMAKSDSVKIKVLTPRKGDIAGVDSRGFLVDLVASFDGDLASTGASLELTGPGAHVNAPPFPGDFSPGHDPSFPGLVVLLSSTKVGAGPGQNLTNLFNIISVTDRVEGKRTDIQATWIIGAPNLFGTVGENVDSELFVAVVEGEAPNFVIDMDNDGDFDKDDLDLMGFNVISNVKQIDFIVNGK